MKPNQRLIILALACLLTSAPAPAAEPFTHAATGITLPGTLAGMERGEITDLEPEVGHPDTAIAYSRGAVEATIYISKRVKELELEMPSPAAVVETSLAAIKEMERRGRYSDVNILKTTSDPKAPEWASGAYTGKMDGRPVISYIHATFSSGYIVKLRITGSLPAEPWLSTVATELKVLVKEAKPKS